MLTKSSRQPRILDPPPSLPEDFDDELAPWTFELLECRDLLGKLARRRWSTEGRLRREMRRAGGRKKGGRKREGREMMDVGGRKPRRLDFALLFFSASRITAARAFIRDFQ